MNINQIAYELYGKYFADLTFPRLAKVAIFTTNANA